MLKIVAISDIHCRQEEVIIPECDILISCGDYSFRGTSHEVKMFHQWFNKQPARYKISVQGNHEKGVEKYFDLSKKVAEEACPDVYFIDEGLIEIEGTKIWCSAITPFFCDWAWNRQRGEEIKKHWDRIPLDIDVLVTHGPPKGILDICYDWDMVTVRDRVGCEDLWNKILELKQLKHHFFGHIHGSYGHKEFNSIHFWNVAICDERYQSRNLPIIVEL